jgi:alpha-beta hydrolase superfamily lysophospholipase
LNSKGYLVFGHNHPGHGPQHAASGTPGHIHDPDPFHLMTSVTHEIYHYIRYSFPGHSHAIFAHSMGSFIVQRMMQIDQPEPDALIYSGSSGKPPASLPFGIFLSGLIRNLSASGKPSRLINSLTFGPYNKPFKPNRTPFDWLSRDSERVDSYILDPACGFIYPATFYHSFFKALQQLHSKRPFSSQTDIPVLLLSGSHDPVSDMSKGVHDLEQILQSSGSVHITKKIYPDGRHEMLNEINRQDVMADIVYWLQQSLSY